MQDLPSSLRVGVQQVDGLAPIGTHHMPVLDSDGTHAVTEYPAADTELLASGQTVALYSDAGCTGNACLPLRLMGAMQVADLQQDNQTALLGNIAAAGWIRAFVGDSDGRSWREAATSALAAAANGHAEGSPESWLQIVAAPHRSLSLTGKTNARNCSALGATHTEQASECHCRVELPQLYSPAAYSVQQAPILVVDITFKENAPEQSVQAVQAALGHLVPAAEDLGRTVCMSEPHTSISRSADDCERGPAAPPAPREPPSPPGAPAPPPAVPPLPPPPPPPPTAQACAPEWAVSLYHGA